MSKPIPTALWGTVGEMLPLRYCLELAQVSRAWKKEIYGKIHAIYEEHIRASQLHVLNRNPMLYEIGSKQRVRGPYLHLCIPEKESVGLNHSYVSLKKHAQFLRAIRCVDHVMAMMAMNVRGEFYCDNGNKHSVDQYFGSLFVTSIRHLTVFFNTMYEVDFNEQPFFKEAVLYGDSHLVRILLTSGFIPLSVRRECLENALCSPEMPWHKKRDIASALLDGRLLMIKERIALQENGRLENKEAEEQEIVSEDEEEVLFDFGDSFVTENARDAFILIIEDYPEILEGMELHAIDQLLGKEIPIKNMRARATLLFFFLQQENVNLDRVMFFLKGPHKKHLSREVREEALTLVQGLHREDLIELMHFQSQGCDRSCIIL